MANLGGRIQTLRKQSKLTQAQLANQIEISSTQLVRYENKGTQPPADVLKKLADLFNVSIDFLVNGDTEEKANKSLEDNDLLMQFKKVEKLNDDDKSTVKKLIDAFLFKSNVQQQLTA
jgi:transcriptional regulator with XRE-family HTH domain